MSAVGNNKTYDLLVFIGRFSPFHAGHRRVAELALQQAKHLLVLVGSSYQARTIKNPFTFEERHQMILASLDPQYVARTTVRPLRDFLYNEQQWISQVQQNVDLTASSLGKAEPKIGLIGFEKDDSSYYLKIFPQYDFIDVGINYQHQIDATTIRKLWLSGQSPNFTRSAINSFVHEFIYEKFPRAERDRLARELVHIEEYKKSWEKAPYPPIFTTVDAVVIQSGHILIGERKSAPGEGLLCLPGGFLEQNETIKAGVFRELTEETKLKVPPGLVQSLLQQCPRHVFDAVGRSLRGRTVTHAFLIDLPPGPLPKVKGRSDMRNARWISLSDFEKLEDQFFEDHHYIVRWFLGRV